MEFIICGNSIKNVQRAQDAYLDSIGDKLPEVYKQGKVAYLLKDIDKDSDAYAIIKASLAQEGEFAHYYKMKGDKVITKLRLF